MVQVDSEAIAEIQYDPDRTTLFVQFVGGDWYSYFEVPLAVYLAFVAAESHGRFFQENFRDRYDYRRDR